LFGLALLAFGFFGFESLTSPAWAAEPPAASPAAGTEPELPALPAVPKVESSPPERAELEDLDSRLQHFLSDKVDERKDAVREVLEVRPKLIAAVLQRLDKLAARADRERMKRALAQVREKSGRTQAGDPGSRDSTDSRGDLLLQIAERARPKDAGWRDLAELVALSRMLTQIGQVHAARGLIEIYVRFGEFMRVDVQNRLLDLKDGAVAALIEARRHRAEKVARWAERQLDRLGKAAPSEAIRTDDFEILGDVLRAYGRTRDPDAARIIVTYASSERFVLRQAARQAIVLLGEVGIWQLRDAYETVVGKRPRRDWSWDRTARELFFEYDKLHAAKAYETLELGNKAAAEGRLQDMGKAYDSLLARVPQFDRAASLAPGYFRLAEKLARDDPAGAEIALVRVERLATDPTLQKKARSLRDTLTAEQYLAHGVVDTYLVRRALEQDANNERAKQLLTLGDHAKVEALTVRARWLTSGSIALTAAIAIGFVLARRGGRPKTARSGPPAERAAEPLALSEAEPPTVSVAARDRAAEAERPMPLSHQDQRAPDVIREASQRATIGNCVSASGDTTAVPAGDAPASASGDAPASASGDAPSAVVAPAKPRDPFEDLF